MAYVMDCQTVRENLTFFLDDELEREASRRLQDHLDDCADCRDRLGWEQAVHQRLRRHLAPGEPPVGLAERIRGQARPSPRGPLRAWLSPAHLVPAAALSALFIGAFLWAQHLFPGGGAESPGTAVLAESPGPIRPQRVGTGPPASLISPAGAPVHMTGTLICLWCEMAPETGRFGICKKYGHQCALRAEDGELWYFLLTDEVAQLLADRAAIGRDIALDGRAYHNARYLDVKTYRLL